MRDPRPLVIGIGNSLRSDDGAGAAVVAQLRATAGNDFDLATRSGEGGALVSLWEGRRRVLVIDAVCSGAPPGTRHRIEAHRDRVPSRFFHYSTHHFSLAEAVELSRALGTLPEQLVLYGIEGKCFDPGETLSPWVRAAVEALVPVIVQELALWNRNEVIA